MTRYHVLVADGLMEHAPECPDGFRFIEPSGPGYDGYTRWWLVEDDNAPAELEQHRVEPVLMRIDGVTVLTERHVVNSHGQRVTRDV